MIRAKKKLSEVQDVGGYSVNFDALYQPFPSQRTPVYAQKGMVATSQYLAAQSGLEILKMGGNAIDAAIATAACLTVVEPTSKVFVAGTEGRAGSRIAAW